MWSLALLSIAGLAACLLADKRALRTLARAEKATLGQPLHAIANDADFSGAPLVDYGVGNAHVAVLKPSTDAYRDIERPALVIRGDRATAMGLVKGALLEDGIALSVCVGLAVLAITIAPSADPPSSSFSFTTPEAKVSDPAVSVIYTDSWAGADVELLGVDETAHHAYLRLVSAETPSRASFDTIDYLTGARTLRHEVTVGTPEEHAMLADIARDTAKPARRGLGLSEGFSESGTGVVFTEQAKWAGSPRPGLGLFKSDTDGRHKDSVAVGLGTVVDPVFGPAGAGLAVRVRPGNRESSLFLMPTADSPPVRLAQLLDPIDPTWSTDGKRLFALDRSTTANCLYRIDGANPGSAGAFICDDGHGEGRFLADDRAATGVIQDGPLGSFDWVDLKTGEVKAKVAGIYETTMQALSSEGILVVSGKDQSNAVIDFRTGTINKLKTLDGRVEGTRSKWTSRGLLMLHTRDGSPELELIALKTEWVTGWR